MNTSKTHFGPRSSNQACSEPSINTNSPKQARRSRQLVHFRLPGFLRLPQPFHDHQLAHALVGQIRMPCTSASFSCASVGPKSFVAFSSSRSSYLLRHLLHPDDGCSASHAVRSPVPAAPCAVDTLDRAALLAAHSCSSIRAASFCVKRLSLIRCIDFQSCAVSFLLIVSSSSTFVSLSKGTF